MKGADPRVVALSQALKEITDHPRRRRFQPIPPKVELHHDGVRSEDVDEESDDEQMPTIVQMTLPLIPVLFGRGRRYPDQGPTNPRRLAED
jgi:hypothetical protein